MELNNLSRRAIDKRFVLQLLVYRFQFALNFRDLLFEALALARVVDIDNEQNVAERSRRDRSSRHITFVRPDVQLTGVEQA